MKRRINLLESIDWPVIFLYLILVTMGWLNIYAAVYNENDPSIFDTSLRCGKQFIWITIAIFLALLFLMIDSKFYFFFGDFFYGFTILLLIIVLIFGKEVNGAKSWINIGPLAFQPGEFAKLGTSMALASYMSNYNYKISRTKDLLITSAIILVPMVLIFIQPDAGSAIIFSALIIMLYREGLHELIIVFLISLAVLFIFSLLVNQLILLIALSVLSLALFGYFSKRLDLTLKSFVLVAAVFGLLFVFNYFQYINISYYFLLLISIGIAIVYFMIFAYINKMRFIYIIISYLVVAILFSYSVDYFFNNILEDHQQKRINTLLGIEEDPLGVGYNVNQSKIAIGSGGFNGKGYLRGTQTKFNFVPEQYTDFIFCTVGEEWGFMGTAVVVLLYLGLLLRLVFLAERQRAPFGRIFGYCVLSIFFFHFLINIGMTIGLMPVIGIPLPFFSYGGSSLWAFTSMLFIFLKIDATRKQTLV